MTKLSFPERVVQQMQLEKAAALEESRLPENERPCQFVTVAEFASLLRVSPRTVYRMIGRGEIPAYRLRGMIRICWRDVWDVLDGWSVDW